MTSFVASVSAKPLAARLPRWAGLSVWAAVAAAGSLAVAAWRWQQMGDFPTGIDPGNWLAFGDDLLGENGKSTAGAYPPLVPAAIALLGHLASPLLALKIVGLGSLVVVFLAVMFVVGRATRNLLLAASAATLASMAAGVLEPLAFGGYPQNYGLAFGVVAIWALSESLRAGAGRTPWLLAAAAFAATAAAHHMYFYLANAAALACAVTWLTTAPGIRRSAAGLARVISVAGVGWLAFLPTYLALQSAGYDAPLNAARADLLGAFRLALGDGAWLWVGVLLGALIYLALTVGRRAEPWWQLGAALLGPALVLFAATGETRLLAMAVTGSVVTMALAMHDLCSSLRRSTWGELPILALPLAAVLLLPVSHTEGRDMFTFYRVMDADLEEAAAWIEQSAPRATVAVAADRHGWPLGWWLEGLTSAHVLVGSDPQWLAFPEERANARIANGFTVQPMSATEALVYAASHDVNLLLTSRTDWIGWRSWVHESDAQITIVFENMRYVVLELAR